MAHKLPAGQWLHAELDGDVSEEDVFVYFNRHGIVGIDPEAISCRFNNKKRTTGVIVSIGNKNTVAGLLNAVLAGDPIFDGEGSVVFRPWYSEGSPYFTK